MHALSPPVSPMVWTESIKPFLITLELFSRPLRDHKCSIRFSVSGVSRTPVGLQGTSPQNSPTAVPPAAGRVGFKNARRDLRELFMAYPAVVAVPRPGVSISLLSCLFSPSDFRFPP